MRRRGAGLFASVALWTLLLLHQSDADWWNLALPNFGVTSLDYTQQDHKDLCNKSTFFVERQRQLCAENDNILPVLGMAAKLAVEECQFQFANNRWNCTIYPDLTNATYGKVAVSNKSRETAFLQAISAASVAYAVTRACYKGELPDCSCDETIRSKKTNRWKWGSCSENIKYGDGFSREFLDVREDPSVPLGLMNRHNNEAGRRAVRSRMQRVCKCHGVSGSCNVQVCWRRLPFFRKVSEGLYQRYDGASHVKFVPKRKPNGRAKLKAISPDLKKPNRTELVYLNDSPDYCEKNETLNILGTRGRLCNRTSQGIDGCPLLCCGRGYQTRVRQVEEKCKCEFVWCCNVVCQTCVYRKEEHVCN